jgi:hypothetical protein
MCFSCKLVEDATHKLSIVDKTRDMIFVVSNEKLIKPSMPWKLNIIHLYYNMQWECLFDSFTILLHVSVVSIGQYYMSDDTVSVFEPPARNSGISSGRYLQRMEAPRVPGTKRPYRPSDCYMGQLLHLHERIFELIQADEWTLKYMEADPKQFPLANFNYVSSKVCTLSLWTLC